MALIYFVYGAAFILMGVSILRQPKPADDCRLGQIIWLLALFGLLHGINEWLDLLHIVHGENTLLNTVRGLILPISFLPLLEFGRRLMRPWLGRWASPWLLVLPIGVVLVTAIISQLHWLAISVASRYAIGLPGALLAGAGLLRYSRTREQWADYGRVRTALVVVGLALMIYGVLTGLVVPPLDIPLARTLNSQWFIEQIGVPVQLLRALCALVAGAAIWYILHIFEIVRERQLRQLADETQQALQQTRQLGQEQQMILNATADAIIGLDEQGLVTFSNPAATELFGYSVAELQGQDLHEIIHVCNEGKPHPKQECGVWQFGGQHHADHKTLQHKDGTFIPVEMNGSAIDNENGAIIGAVLTFRDISERLSYEQELERRAHYDELTGLANRVLLNARLQQTIAQAHRHGKSAAVMFLDLDQFKIINDGLGHSYGDRLLVEIARRLQTVIRETDTVARHGGDEFVIVLSEPDNGAGEDTAEIGQRLLKTIAESVHIDEHELYTTASIGVSIFPRDGTDPDALLRNADAAMYRAKHLGRNNLQYYSEEMNLSLSRRLFMLSQLRQAIERNELCLYYQPQASLPGGRMLGVEALLRWQHPKLGMVSPVEFIPLAEESGLIEPIGEWVLREACRQAVAWDQAGFMPMRISVNLSARQFDNPDLDDTIRSVLEQTGLAPERLELELTETALITHPEKSAKRLSAIRKLGIRLALDDFGTGYSSLTYLQRYTFDLIKIDRSFVADAIRNPGNAAIVRTVIAMAHMLGSETIAEGAETAETITYLGRNGCDAIQGYYLSPPLPAGEIEQFFPADNMVRIISDLFPAEAQRTIVFLDDEENILRALQRTLRGYGWQILTTTDPDEALILMARHHVQVVVSDQRMPKMSGVEFMSQIKELYPDSIRIILSAYADLETVTDAVNHGWVYRFLTKPWDNKELLHELEQAFLQSEK
jgi:diguanylate cyclase (GGDEF)-like protein/PAS domain S-box-containing protein